MNKVRFDFGSKPVADGYVKVDGNTVYNEEKGYGILKNAEAECRPT